MKIAITGASSTGKTTLAGELCGSMPEYQRLNVNARELLTKRGERNVADMGADEYKAFQLEYIDQKIRIEGVGNRFIVERSFVDCCAYWDFHCADRSTPAENSRIRQVCEEWSRKYDLHIYLPFGQAPFELDGYRNPSPKYHAEIGAAILGLLRNWGLRHLDCSGLPLNDRHSVCKREIERCER
jgi:nicotinamide riboside kinase